MLDQKRARVFIAKELLRVAVLLNSLLGADQVLQILSNDPKETNIQHAGIATSS